MRSEELFARMVRDKELKKWRFLAYLPAIRKRQRYTKPPDKPEKRKKQ